MTMRRCLNWKVLLGLGGAAALVLIIAPRAAGIVPLLALLACPISMVVMMWSMRGSPTGTSLHPDHEGPTRSGSLNSRRRSLASGPRATAR